MPASIETSAVPTPIFLSPFFRSSTLEWNDICGCLPPAGCSCGPPGHAVSAAVALSVTHAPPLPLLDELEELDEAGAAAAAGAVLSATAGLATSSTPAMTNQRE